LAAANGLNEGSLLQIGQVIRLPGANAPAPAAQTAPAAAAPPVETEPYTVQEGDTLFSIAARRGVTWQEVAAVNGYGEQAILQIGQEIRVPKKKVIAAEMPTGFASAPADPAATAPANTHTVASGETIISIALQHGLDWQQLLALNGLAEDTLLQPGQQLRLR
jgi:LysM repeat protein